MFLRSRDGKRIVEASSFEVKDTVLLVNGAEFERYGSEAAAVEALVAVGRTLADMETFLDLSGEIESDFDPDDDDFDEGLFDLDDGDDEEAAEYLRTLFHRKK